MRSLLLKPNDASVVEINGTLNYTTHNDKVMPWSLGVLANVLRACGDEVRVVDAMAHGLSATETRRIIRGWSPDRVIATVNPICLDRSSNWANGLDEKIVLLLNLPFTSYVKRRIPRAQVVCGDWVSSVAKQTLCIDEYPLPAFDLLPMKRYNHQQIMFSEGCNYGCRFCHFGKLFDRPWRSRPIDAVIEELKALRARGVRFIRVFDNEMGQNSEYIKDLLRQVVRNRLDILWETNIRVSNLDEETVRLMADAGCIYAGYGVESADQSVLDQNDKGITPDQMKRAAELLRRYQILGRSYVLIGLKGADATSIYRTFVFLKRELKSFDTTFDLIVPYPITTYAADLKFQNKLPSEVTPEHVSWIEANLYENPLMAGEAQKKPDWDYDSISFRDACRLVMELRNKAQCSSQGIKLRQLIRKRAQGVRFLAGQLRLNPRGVLGRIWK